MPFYSPVLKKKVWNNLPVSLSVPNPGKTLLWCKFPLYRTNLLKILPTKSICFQSSNPFPFGLSTKGSYIPVPLSTGALGVKYKTPAQSVSSWWIQVSASSVVYW